MGVFSRFTDIINAVTDTAKLTIGAGLGGAAAYEYYSEGE